MKEQHYCDIPSQIEIYGFAITECYEEEDGRLIFDNEESSIQVNFCPICGYEAKVKIETI
jgi:hypothetical protein